jgi:hypothetical protein
MNLRPTLSALMVRLHRITPQLADYHLAQMSDPEVEEHFEMYRRNGLATDVELSAVGLSHRSGDVSSTRFSRPETMTACSRRSALHPIAATESGPVMPDSEVKNRGRRAAVSSGGRRRTRRASAEAECGRM